jgi:hypothetical protein
MSFWSSVGSFFSGDSSSSSTVSDSDFDAAIAQDLANRNNNGGGISYGTGGYIGSDSSSSSPDPVVAAPKVYTAKDGTKYTNVADRDAQNAKIAEAARQEQIAADKVQANTSFNATYDQLLNQIVGTKGYYTADDVAAAYKQAQESTTNNQYVTATTAGLLSSGDPTFGGDMYNQNWLDDTITSFLKGADYATPEEKALPSVTQSDMDEFKWSNLFGSVGGMFDEAFTSSGEKAAIEIVDSLAAAEGGTTAKGASSAEFSVIDGKVYVDAPYQREGAIDPNGLAVDFGEQFRISESSLNALYKNTDFYGTGIRAETAFAEDMLKAQQAASANSIDMLTGDRTLTINPEGRIVVGEGVSLANTIASGIDTVVNKGINYGLGYAAGALMFSLTGGIAPALYTAFGTRQVLDTAAMVGNGIVNNQVFVDGDGTQWVDTTIAGERSMYRLDEMFENATTNAANADTKLASGDFDIGESLNIGMGGSAEVVATNPQAQEATGTKKLSWSDYGYDLDFSFDDLVKQTLVGANASAETIKGIEFATQVANGTNVAEAAINIYGDKIVDVLPTELNKPTEAAIRVGLGENKIKVFGDIYGADVGLDNPLGQAGLSSAITYDQTGDGQQAITDGLVTYVKKGGTFPEFEVPDFLPDDVDTDFDFEWLTGITDSLPDMKLGDWVTDFKLPTGVFNGVNFGDIAANFPDIKIPSMKELGIEIGKLDFSGTSFAGLGDYIPNINIPKMIDLGIKVPEVDFTGANFADLDMSLPEIQDLGIDWKGINLDGIPLPELLLAGGADQAQQDAEQLAYEDPFADTTEEEDTLPTKTPLSQVLLKTTPVA